MADLRLQVIMTALDNITGPLKKIRGAASPTSAALKATSERLKELNQQQGAAGKFRELHAGLSTTSQQLKIAQANVNHLAKEFKTAASPAKEMAKRFEDAKAAAKKLSIAFSEDQIKLQGLRDEMARAGIQTGALRGAIANAGKSTANFGLHQRQLRTDIAATTAQLEEQKNKLAAVARQQARMAKVRAQFAKTRDFAGNAAAVGITSGAMGGGMLMGARRMLTPGVDFNAAMSRVQALSGLDKQSEAFTGLRDQSRTLGATTSYTATEAAEGQGYLAMAGFKPDEILQSMPTVLSMAKAGGSDLARTADIASDILTSFGLQSDQMARVGDVLTMTFTTANTNLEMLGDTMKYVGPIAKAAGMSLEQASAMAGLLGNAGIKSSMAGTTLRSMLLRLAAPTSKAASALDELGIASRDLKGDVRDIPAILRDVADATKLLGSGQRLDYLKQIFGEEPAAGMAALIDKQGADGINRYVAIIENAKGVARKTATIMADNLQGDLQTMRSSWEDLGITASDAIDQPLRRVTSRIADILRGISKWMQHNPALTASLLKIALGIGAVMAVTGTLALTLASIVVPIAALKMALGLLGLKAWGLLPALRNIGGGLISVGSRALVLGRTLAGPLTILGRIVQGAMLVGATIAGLPLWGIAALTAVLVGAAIAIYKFWGPISSFFIGLFKGLTRGIGSAAMPAFKALGSALSWLWEGMRNFGGMLVHCMPFLALLAKAFEPVKVAILWIIEGLSWLWQPMRDTSAAAESMGERIGNSVGKVVGWILALPAKFATLGVNIITGLINGMTGMLGWVQGKVAGIADSVIGVFKDKLGIRSPSRVFASVGDHTMQGLAIGLQRSEDAPVAQVSSLAKRLTQLGAGIAIGAATMPAMAFDTRPPMAPPGANGGTVIQGDTIQITIQTTPGMDGNAIALAVAQALDRRDREKRARQRSSLHDY
ncbi:phage tail tape measure protein [Glaciimonas sp. PAMC28666]|uniref:phage tail tape measure protein n=1 Tax=Glaciimonas sp. PAMC28666 TaxID=2807626 RepID=UPI0019646513|nr:phage tail tape measure protein [Glaciimonas sp. PAMC28666]QRX80886.1 phage tail tape measure protein [Glaciimonas sp. PAMC28666]